jgi:hypothetical protein
VLYLVLSLLLGSKVKRRDEPIAEEEPANPPATNEPPA